MNELFVNIKVDREERPDLDRIYQIAHQMLTQRGGGWPLTMFLTHDDQQPFFGGTYFPDEARYGMPAFRDLLARVAEYYRERGNEVREQNAALMRAFARPDARAGGRGNARACTTQPLREARRRDRIGLRSQLGRLRLGPEVSASGHDRRPAAPLARDGVRWRARAGSAGAVHGHADTRADGRRRALRPARRWFLPLLGRRVLDDSALREDAVRQRCPARLLCAGCRRDRRRTVRAGRRRAPPTGCMRDLQAPEGGFWSSLDADSEGHEGRFYVWQPEQVRALLEPAEYAVFAPRFGLDREANFEGEYWHLHSYRPIEDIAASPRHRRRGCERAARRRPRQAAGAFAASASGRAATRSC
jgi:hypothetical protein